MQEGFTKAFSDTLPKVDSDMITEFYIRNSDFFSAEMRNVKTRRSTREAYGDNAVGYVQLKRQGDSCIVRAKVTPEHKIHKSAYDVEVIINEKEEAVLHCECKDCAASEGGCKHGVAFLLWLHRRSEEPALTAVSCYWKKSSLSKVGTHKMDLASIFGKNITPLSDSVNLQFGQQLTKAVPQAKGGLFDILGTPNLQELSIYQLFLKYKQDEKHKKHSADDFINFMKPIMTDTLCKLAEKNTRSQSECTDWYELRFGRITASRVYEAAKCKTVEGSLVETIMGATKTLDTSAVRRGKELEPRVLDQVAKEKNIKIKRCGLVLDKGYPIFGASPDGISDQFCIEVKCPSSDKNIKNYFVDEIICRKYFYQMQLQMFFCNKEKGLFCVASPDFENNHHVTILQIDFEREKCLEILTFSESFWKLSIFPILDSL